jgi:hypothetical protein
LVKKYQQVLATKGAIKYATGFRAEFLIDICHYIQDLKTAGILSEQYACFINDINLKRTKNTRKY